MRRALLVLLVLLCVGCSDPYRACAKAGADVAAAINQGYVQIGQLHTQGLISDSETLSVAGFLKFANDADKTFLTCTESAHTSSTAGAFTACANSFVQSLNRPDETALIRVSNPSAQTTVNNILQGLVGGIETLQHALGGA